MKKIIIAIVGYALLAVSVQASAAAGGKCTSL
jgi:hypothetical protein